MCTGIFFDVVPEDDSELDETGLNGIQTVKTRQRNRNKETKTTQETRS